MHADSLGYLERSPLMWVMLPHLHVNLNANDDDDDDDDDNDDEKQGKFSFKELLR